jgi:TetR/AcrR family transcriptional repressor of uid operon
MRKIDPVKHEERRQQILRAAETCFRRHGFGGATIAAICAEAQMSPGHLYHYFKNKEAIVAAMTEIHLERLEGRFDEMISKSDVVEAFCDEFDKFWKYKSRKRNREALLILEVLAEAGKNPVIAKIVRHRNDRLQQLLAKLLRKGQELGQIDHTIEADAAAAILCVVIDASNNLFIKNPAFDMEDALSLLKRMMRQFMVPQSMQQNRRLVRA